MPDPYPNPSQTPRLARAYKHANYNGPMIEMGPGVFNYNDLSIRGLHDNISSIQVASGAEVVLYEDVEGGEPRGQSWTIIGPEDIPNFKNAGIRNDAISAIRVQRVSGETGNGSNGNGANGNGANGNGGNGTSDTSAIQGGLPIVEIAAKATAFRVQAQGQVPPGLGPGAVVELRAQSSPGAPVVRQQFTISAIEGPYGSGAVMLKTQQPVQSTLASAARSGVAQLFGVKSASGGGGGGTDRQTLIPGVSNTTLAVGGFGVFSVMAIVLANR